MGPVEGVSSSGVEEPYEGFVLAGGQSRRMGRDKAMLPVGGRPLISVSIDALGDAERVTVVGGPDRSDELGVPWIADAVGGGGPLVGLLTALGHARAEAVVVLACDLPAVTRSVPARLLAALGDADAAVPIIGGRPQWTASAWRTRALPMVRAAHEAGRRSVWAAAGELRLVFLLDRAREYADVDTPADLESLADVIAEPLAEASGGGEEPSLT